jgi:hypothetical protein
VIACRKNDNLSSSNNGSKLTAISSDSAGAWRFGYTGDLITSMVADTSLRPYGFDASIQYSHTGSIDYVTVNSMTYSLTSLKLPSQIYETETVGGTEQKHDIATFTYLPNTGLLDSVLLNHYIDTIIFKFTYTGENITTVTETQVSNNERFALGSFNYTYSATPNIFRQADPLLYIYAYPQTALFAQSMVVATFFAETFSASTFSSITTSGATNSAWGQDSMTGNMTYTVNANGKVTGEVFDNEIFKALAGKKYYY